MLVVENYLFIFGLCKRRRVKVRCGSSVCVYVPFLGSDIQYHVATHSGDALFATVPYCFLNYVIMLSIT